MNGRSEEIRLRYLYRKLVLVGKARISLGAALALVGPDCAFQPVRTAAEAAIKREEGTRRLIIRIDIPPKAFIDDGTAVVRTHYIDEQIRSPVAGGKKRQM